MASLRVQTEYRFNFIVNTIISGSYTVVDFLLLFFLVLRFDELGGWTIGELAILYGVIEAGTGLFKLFGYGFEHFEMQMVTGQFDTCLIRPVSPLVLMILQRVDFRRIASVIQAVVIGWYGVLSVQGLRYPIVLVFCLLAFGSFLMQLEINWLLASIAFWTVKNEDLQVLAYYSTRTASIYPLDIFGPVFKNLLTFIIPLGTVGYYPLRYIFGKTENVLALLSPVIGVLGLLPVCVVVWKLGLRHYTSTGT
jgi:ABC-2 type transport system permease protein